MINIGNKSKIFICTFVFAIILCGAVSAATTVNISSDGKNITITPSNVPSTLKTAVSASVKNGAYGYGQYVILKITGHDNQGVNKNSTVTVYNNVIKTIIDKFSSANGIETAYSSVVFNSKAGTMKMNGKDGNLTFSGTGTLPIFNVHGQILVNNCISNSNYYWKGILCAKCNETIISSYKLINGEYQDIKDTDTTNTLYSNGNTRTSIITKVFIRNSKGTETGLVTTGTSKGTEKINNKTVSYTGKITISTRYDPKDVINEGYDTGTYKEVRTSSSPVLIKEIPLDAL